MTRIRRINVSQVEGDNADNTSTDEIRPFGETAFYIDDNNKLTLMMFDGVRTHRDSKVLSPGVLYGSNADAGDGSGSDTIKLIPDAGLGTDQYIVVDPTAGVPGHIHLRAGGTQDASTADLYLGGEITNVRVSDTTLDVVITTNEIGIDPAQNSWTFDNTGGLTFPGGASVKDLLGETLEESVLILGAGSTIAENQRAARIGLNGAVSGVSIGAGTYDWSFTNDGSLTFPGGMTIETEYGGSTRLVVDGKSNSVDIRSDGNILIGYNSSGNVFIGNPNGGDQVDIVGSRFRLLVDVVPTSSTGASGDQQGQIAVDNSYIYYCTQDYVGNSTSVTTLASSGTTAWVDSTDYAGDLVADFTANPIGWTYNGVTIVNIVADNTFGPGYALEGPVGGFSVINSYNYALVNPSMLPNIWKRVAWGGSTW